ncbi:MAG: bifunctional homocysteine S-methyltransferase/methylenetetrahydrofolate reductase [Clostridiaceae bacterium]|nr:bifunctional homocysteine S-methyltransferase/methylenetetrahydrofolate reductase [Clostridiaceae bacterium]
MRPARELLEDKLVLADGAMGTYYAQLAARDADFCERANVTNPELIRRIHQEYLAAGARLLRTNTFAAAALFGMSDPAGLKEVVSGGFKLAVACAGNLAFVAADCGPAYNLDPEAAVAAERIVVDTFLENGAELFLFETYADPDEFLGQCRYIKNAEPSAVIIASFTLSADGYTRKGLSISHLSDVMQNCDLIDIWGFNCGVGPTHLAEQLKRLPVDGKPLTVMPNSGYPKQENSRLVFVSSPDYFAQTTAELVTCRTRLIGGCCGTTPHHIHALRQALVGVEPAKAHPQASIRPPILPQVPAHPRLVDGLTQNKFTIAVELNPPRTSQMEPLIAAARQLQLAGVDTITVTDSPLARVKMDSVCCASRLARETGLPILPHICCRDRNVNALRSSLLAAHSEGIRQILAITGDAIPESDKGFVKPVFNLGSLGLIQLIQQMNQDEFADDPMLIAAALDPGVAKPEVELSRAMKKIEAGATLFLTQPVYDTRGLSLIRQVRRTGGKVLIGLLPPISYRNAQFLSQEVPGIRIPAELLRRFHPDMTREAAVEAGLEATVEVARIMQPDADGFYLIAPFNRADIMVQLHERLR